MDLLPRWNPLRKKSGLMSVMHAQTKKGRVVSKHGRINTFRRKEEVRHDKHRSSEETRFETIFALSYRYLKDFFTSMIELSWSWTLFSFAASFFISWLGFAVAWYLFRHTCFCGRFLSLQSFKSPFTLFSNQVHSGADTW